MEPLDHLQTEARNPASMNLDELTTLELVRLMNAEDARVATAVGTQAEAIARAIDVIAHRLRTGGRLVYVGAGTSGRLGILDAAECPPTFNATPGQIVGVIAGGSEAITRAVEGAEDRPELAEQDLDAIGIAASDAVVGIATSGRTPYVLSALVYARRRGAYTIGLSCNPDSELIPRVDLAITPVVGPEVLSGSTRLKAGTATKLVLNTLTTGAMVRLGKTFGNLMVDLRATNAKLRARTNRIIRTLTALDAQEADALLERCNRELKTALVTRLAGVSPEEARARLNAAGGRVRQALTAAPMPAPAPAPSGTLVLGIDGGGSNTVALLARPAGDGTWTTLGRGVSGPSNVKAVGQVRALQAVDDAVAKAFAAAGLPRAPGTAAVLGLAGAGRPEEQSIIRDWALRTGIATSVDVTGDAPLIIAAGTPEGWGLAVISGTGSMAYAEAPDGRSARAGGWGYLLGDEGSGYTIALAGLRAVACAADDRGPPTRLTARFLTALSLAWPQQLITAVYGSPDRTALAALAPLVLETADEGDAVAETIAAQAARELAQTTAAAARRLAIDRPLPLALSGGVLLASESYRRRLLAEIESLGVKLGPVACVADPAEGALRMALRLVR